MSKPIKPTNNRSNQQNPNKGSSGTNHQYDQAQGNKGKQKNPNQQNKKLSANQRTMNNRSEQLNPINEKFLKSRASQLTQEDVSMIQQAEIKNTGSQSKEGLGAEAQKILSKKTNKN